MDANNAQIMDLPSIFIPVLIFTVLTPNAGKITAPFALEKL